VTPILILTATELEARRLARELELLSLPRFSFPVFGRGSVRLAPVGLGAALLDSRWLRLADALDRPLVVSAGVCGGLDPRLSSGDLVLPERVLSADGLARTVDAAAHRQIATRWREPVSTGALVTAAAVVATPEAKAALFRSTGAVGVDMESSIVAERAAAAGFGSLVVRAVADGASQALPLRLASMVAPDGRVRLGRALALTMARPSTVPAALDLRRRTALALGAVARALSLLIG